MCAEGGRQDPTGRPEMGQLGQRWIWKPEHRVGSSPSPPRPRAPGAPCWLSHHLLTAFLLVHLKGSTGG